MTSSRDREIARQKQVRQAQKNQEATDRQRRNRLIGGGLLAAALVLGGGFFIVNALASDTGDSTNPTADASPSTSAAPVNCEKPKTVQTQAKQYPNGPEGIVLADATLGLKIESNCGPFEIQFDAKGAPKNTEAMIFLANTGAPIFKEPGNDKSEVLQVQGYFDDTPCHRLTTEGIFVLQCGDPTGTGSGSPGFTTADEGLPPDLKEGENGTVIYPRGTVAMANSGPNTNGSQIFIVYKDSPLSPDYVVLGTISKGLEVIDTVAKAGVAGGGADGKPAEQIVLTKVLSFETREVGAP